MKYKNTKILGIEYPLIGLAPMDGVSDSPMRIITKKHGKVPLMYTEFTHVMGLCIAGHKVLDHFYYTEAERPLIAQIYGADPEYFYHAAKIVCALGFDGVDINMGCPAKNVASRGSGAALINTPDLAREIIYETKRGVGDWVKDGKITGMKSKPERKLREMIEEFKNRVDDSPLLVGEGGASLRAEGEVKSEARGILNLTENRVHIPVSVKTRIGFDEPVTESWIKNLEKAKPEWIAVHGRTLKQMYSRNADYTELKKAVEITDIPVLVNGDILDLNQAHERIKETGAFGALIGRGALGNPWVFNEQIPSHEGGLGWVNTQPVQLSESRSQNNMPNSNNPPNQTRNDARHKDLIIKTLIEHAEVFVNQHTEERAFVQMRKHFGWYLKGFDGAKELRKKLVRVKDLDEVKGILQSS